VFKKQRFAHDNLTQFSHFMSPMNITIYGKQYVPRKTLFANQQWSSLIMNCF